MNSYFIILCGGSGTRLWPLSRKNRPKQLIPFINNKSLLEQTIDRLHIISKNKEAIGLITTEEQATLIPKAIYDTIGFTFKEPTPRNTAPAICYSCLELEKQDKEAVVVFLPADHFIPQTEKYGAYLQKAIDYAQNNNTIVTLGLMPTYPATGYGYIQADTSDPVTAGNFYNIQKFHEKPTKEKATAYLNQGNMFWNLGMFVGKVQVFLDEYKKHAPEILNATKTYQEEGKGYDQAPNISIDFAIMEKSNHTSLLPCDFTWNDVGNLDLFLSIQQKYNVQAQTKIISIDGKNNIAKTTKKLVAFVDVDDLCVIETDDVILVAKRSDVEKVKKAHMLLPSKKLDFLL